MGDELLYADGEKDMTKLIVNFFRNFANAHKNILKEATCCKSVSKHCLHKQTQSSMHFRQNAI